MKRKENNKEIKKEQSKTNFHTENCGRQSAERLFKC